MSFLAQGRRWDSRILLPLSCQQQQPQAPPEEGGPAAAHPDVTSPSLSDPFYILVKAIYTLGYSVSLISLTTGSIILCLFR